MDASLKYKHLATTQALVSHQATQSLGHAQSKQSLSYTPILGSSLVHN